MEYKRPSRRAGREDHAHHRGWSMTLRQLSGLLVCVAVVNLPVAAQSSRAPNDVLVFAAASLQTALDDGS